MRLFFDYKTTRRLASLLTKIPPNVSKISAAVAFTQDGLLIDACIKNKIELEWWGLFNSKISTRMELVKKAIVSQYITFYPFAEYFHPKVIHFHGYGIYIGSHNMTGSAMYKNVEAGVFIEDDSITPEQRSEIEGFFSYLRNNSMHATIEDVKRIDEYLGSTAIDRDKQDEAQAELDDLFEEQFKHLFILKPGVTDFGTKVGDVEKKRKLNFMQEWRSAQNKLAIVQERIVNKCSQPTWVDRNANSTILTDQLLHAYYFSYLLKGSDERSSMDMVKNEYFKNRHDPERAVDAAISWWEKLETAPSSEDVHINIWSLSNQRILGELRRRDLSEGEVLTVMRQNHAARNHARQIENAVFKKPADFRADIDHRVRLYVSWLMRQRTAKGLTINETLKYLLFEDSVDVEERVYECVYNPKYRLEHFGKSIVGETIGWGRPEITHLRNDRVNKALRCLGYDVRIFSARV